MLWCGTRAYPRLQSVLHTDTEALKWAIVSAASLGYRDIIFETDSKDLVEALQRKSVWPVLRIVHQIISQNIKCFGNSKIKLFLREGNQVADRIAWEAFSLEINDPIMYSLVLSWLNVRVKVDKP